MWYKLIGGEAQSQSSKSNTQEVLLTYMCGKMMAEEAATRNVGIMCVALLDAASCKHLRVRALKIVFCKHRVVSPVKEAISLLQYQKK